MSNKIFGNIRNVNCFFLVGCMSVALQKYGYGQHPLVCFLIHHSCIVLYIKKSPELKTHPYQCNTISVADEMVDLVVVVPGLAAG
jgi:hypothetical protein